MIKFANYMINKIKYSFLLLIFPLTLVLFYFIQKKQNQPLRELAVFGPKNYSTKKDTIFHTVSAFSFTNQNNQIITDKYLQDKIYVTEFFFTTCQSICPIMNKNLEKVYNTFLNDTSVFIVSHTVDPEVDSSKVLKAYADLHGVKNNQWQFLTGSKRELYKMARQSYLLNNETGDGSDEDFIHTQNFALVDREKRIRGFYDGTDTAEINRLIIDINLLKQYYEFTKK